MARKDPTADFRHALKITGAAEDVPRMIVAAGPACGGNVMFIGLPRPGVANVQEMILVHAVPGGKGKPELAKVWRTDMGLGPSHHPEIDIDINAAVAELRAVKGRVPVAGPAVLRGDWKGELRCIGGQPSVSLTRKVVAYGALTVESQPDGRWKSTFVREGRWFAEAKQQSVQRSGLAEAIQAGMGLVIGLTGEACAVRDTHRSTAPSTPRPSVTDQQRLDAARKKAAELEAKLQAPAAPKPPRAPAKPKADPVEKWVDKRRTGVPTLASVPAETLCPTCVDGMDSAVRVAQQDAKVLAKVPRLDDVEDAPEWLGRAAKLIRRAGVLLESPLCRGRERDEAVVALKEAIKVYNETRANYQKERDNDIELVSNLKRISERVALTAAKIGRSCHSGQMMIPASPAALPAAPRATVSAPIASGFGLHGMPGVTVQAPSPYFVEDKLPRRRKPRAAAPAGGKDAVIGGMFLDAIKQAAAQMRGGQ